MNFPKDIWMKLVEKQTYGYAYRHGVYGGMGGNWWDEMGYGGRGWDDCGYPTYNRNMPGGGVCGNPRQNGYTHNVDPDAWKNNRHVVIKNGRVCIVPGGTPQVAPPPGLPPHPQNVGVKVSPIEFPPHEQEDFNPCSTCMFRDVKIEWAIEMFTEEVEDDLPDDKATDNYLIHPRLVESSLQVAEGEGMPINISGADPEAEMYYCEVCKRIYWISPKEKAECSVCQSPMFKYSKEEELHEQSSVDSGALLIPDSDEFEKATMRALAKAAETERFLLPEPGKESIPINGRPEDAPRFSIRKLLQICKKGK
jgi:hypothetical protein